MILSKTEELRMFMPSHNLQNMQAIAGFIDNSEHDFLMERVGAPLLKAVNKKYSEVTDVTELLPTNAANQTAWQQLIVLCQRCVAYDAMNRAADVLRISLNGSGINIAESDGYDGADKDAITRFKSQCNIEAHAAVNRLLLQLEEWCEACGKTPAPDESTLALDTLADEREIVKLWKESRYYYKANGLFLRTATAFGEFVDIYDSREKFVNLLPDIRICQDVMLRNLIGDELTTDLLEKYLNGQLNEIEDKCVYRIQHTLASMVETRSNMFKRPEAKDEMVMNERVLAAYIQKNQAEFDEEAMKASPLYVEPPKAPKPDPNGEPPRKPEPWRNNRKGNRMFVTDAIY